MKRCSTGLASALLSLWVGGAALLWSAATMSACLLPQDDHYLDDLPPAQNLPPLILESTATPGRRVTIGSADPCALEFRAYVLDLDLNDRLRTKWFIDYDPTNPRGPYKETVIEPSGTSQRSEAALLDEPLNTAGFPVGELGEHVVELVVSDRELIGRQPVQIPDGGTSFVTSYAWLVEVSGACTP